MLQTQITCPAFMLSAAPVSLTTGIPTSLPPKYGIWTRRESIISQLLRSQITLFWVWPVAGYMPHVAE